MIAVISLVVSIIGMAATVTTAIVTSYANIQRSRQVPKPNIKAELRSVKVDHPTPRKGVLFPENHPDIVIKAMATIRFTNYGVGDAYDIHVKATQDRLPIPHEPREISIARMKNGDYFEIRVPVSCQFGHIPDDTEDEWSGTVDYSRVNLEFTWKTAANQNRSNISRTSHLLLKPGHQFGAMLNLCTLNSHSTIKTCNQPRVKTNRNRQKDDCPILE